GARRRNAAREGIVAALIQAADSAPIEPSLLHLEIGAQEGLRRKLFDGEANSLGGAGEALVANSTGFGFPVSGREELSLCGVVKIAHDGNLTNAGLPNCDDGKTSGGSYIQCPKLKGNTSESSSSKLRSECGPESAKIQGIWPKNNVEQPSL